MNAVDHPFGGGGPTAPRQTQVRRGTPCRDGRVGDIASRSTGRGGNKMSQEVEPAAKVSSPTAATRSRSCSRWSSDEVVELLPATTAAKYRTRPSVEKEKLQRRPARRGEEETANDPIRTHLQDMPILPEFVGLTFEATPDSRSSVRVEPEMIGHYLGEFQLTRTSVEHGQAGIGATRSSKFPTEVIHAWESITQSTRIPTPRRKPCFGSVI